MLRHVTSVDLLSTTDLFSVLLLQAVEDIPYIASYITGFAEHRCSNTNITVTRKHLGLLF